MASLRSPAIMAAFFAFQAFSMAAELRLKQTPHGAHYGIVADHPGGPAPTLFIIGNPISMMNQANMRYLHGTGEVLAKHGWIYVMLDPACEGFNAKGGEPSGLNDWAAHAKKGEDFMGPYVQNCRDVLDHLIAAGVTDAERIAVQGVSRGGFCAFHFAAREPRIRAVVGISPVTNPLALTELAGVTVSQVAPFSLDAVLEKLVARPLWISIGNSDVRVSTDECIGFTRRLVAASHRLQPKLNLIPVQLHVGVSAGHRSPDDAYASAAEFLIALFPSRKP